MNLSKFQRAIQGYDEAIRLAPSFAVAYVNRARAYTHLGKDKEAQEDVDRAVEPGFERSMLDGQIEELKKQR